MSDCQVAEAKGTPLFFSAPGAAGLGNVRRGRKKDTDMENGVMAGDELTKSNLFVGLKQIKEIYVVEGETNSGKTGILRAFCNYLKSQKEILDDFEEYKLDDNDLCCKAKLKDGRVIGVGTAGDNADIVNETFLYFGDTNKAFPIGCDVVVIALTKNADRKMRRYRPNRSSAEIALYDVILPAFRPDFSMLTVVVKTERYSKHHKDWEKYRAKKIEEDVKSLKSALKV